jgi:hypothetical protein
MRTIDKRLEKLEKTFAPLVKEGDDWGSMARARDELLRDAEQRGTPPVAQLKKELDDLGPIGLWRETVRCLLQKYGFVQSNGESFADTLGRALGMHSEELRACIVQGQIGTALANRFKGSPGTQ